MELRVWVDGTQRVVCGVKLTTTCQEIVFALAHATQQAGRFTMIERWRNNERLLSPNEQPLVTLQRWGERMNEVEFILRKTSTELPNNSAQVQSQSVKQPQQHHQQQQQQQHQHQHQHQPQSQPLRPATSLEGELANHQSLASNGHLEPSPNGNLLQHHHHQHLHQQQQLLRNPSTLDNNVYHTQPQFHHQQHNNNLHYPQQSTEQRRPHTSMGPLIGMNGSGMSGVGGAPVTYRPNYVQTSQANQLTRAPNSFPSGLGSMAMHQSAPNVTTTHLMPQHHSDEQTSAPSNTSTASLRQAQNGYHIQNGETQLRPSEQAQQQQQQVIKNYPLEDIYSTVNKKRQPPPAVPAKPRVLGTQMGSLSNLALSQQPLQAVSNAQMVYYQQNNPMSLYQQQQNNNPAAARPRHPPGYLDYIEAMANRNSLPVLPGANYAPHRMMQPMHSNIMQRPYDNTNNFHHQQHMQQNGASPVSSSSTNGNRYTRYTWTNGELDPSTLEMDELGAQVSMQSINPVPPKLIDSGLVFNRGSAVNVKLPSSCHNLSSQSINCEQHISGNDNSGSISHHNLNHISRSHNNSLNNGHNNNHLNHNHNKTNSAGAGSSPSLAQIGHDMLKVIEEQKRVLMNQKSELDRLDNDTDYWDTTTKQSTDPEQVELINRIESEIQQLEKLWKDNHTQIQKLETQNFEKGLQDLKDEQVKMESEIALQKAKLERCEKDIMACTSKISLLEMELATRELDISDDNLTPLQPIQQQQPSQTQHVNVKSVSFNKCVDVTSSSPPPSPSRDAPSESSSSVSESPSPPPARLAEPKQVETPTPPSPSPSPSLSPEQPVATAVQSQPQPASTATTTTTITNLVS